MSDNPSLLQQLAVRCRRFHSATGIPQTAVAKAIGMQSGNYNAFLQGNRGLSAEATCALLTFTAMTKQQAIARFSAPVRTSQITNFQSLGQSMELANDGWVSRESGTADPDGTEDITHISDAASNNGCDEATTAILKKVRSLHRICIQTINDALNKAKPNPTGTTPPNNQRFSTRNIRKPF